MSQPTCRYNTLCVCVVVVVVVVCSLLTLFTAVTTGHAVTSKGVERIILAVQSAESSSYGGTSRRNSFYEQWYLPDSRELQEAANCRCCRRHHPTACTASTPFTHLIGVPVLIANPSTDGLEVKNGEPR